MCLAIPGKVLEIYEEKGLKMGRIDYSGTVNKACLECVPEIRPGQYAIVHAGFAISIIDEEEARKTYAVWQEIVKAAAQQGTDIFGIPLDEKNEESKPGETS
ncbi:MAG: HypC/HybG/HupF family hydrogenase formation chaperone [bacterium]